MQFINYFFASVISFLGLAGGVLLLKIAPEEQKPLQKKISILREIFLLLTFAFLIVYYYMLFYLYILTALFIVLLLVEYKLNNSIKKSTFEYALLGILFFLSSKNIKLFVIVSSLIFLHGLPAVPLMCNIKEKSLKNIFSYNLIFVVVANLLMIVAR